MRAFCAYIGAECDHASNALECAQVSAVKCRTVREKLEQERQERERETVQ
jgi:hypothetical protein